MSKIKKTQSRVYGLILPCEWKNCMEIVHHSKTVAKYYYWIKHNRDFYGDAPEDLENGESKSAHAVGELKKEHIHLLMKFNNSRDLKTVHNYFSQFSELKENSFEIIRNDHGAKRYLTHADNPEKAQYKIEEVETNDKLFANVFVDKISSSEELGILKRNYKFVLNRTTFDEYIDLWEPVLAGMNSYQKSMIFFKICDRWERLLSSKDLDKKKDLDKIPY
jgi:hypothetical protein